MPDATKRPYPWQRRRRKALMIIFVFLGVTAGPIFLYRGTAEYQLHQAVTAIREAGFPTTDRELAAWKNCTPNPSSITASGTKPETPALIPNSFSEDTAAALIKSMEEELCVSKPNPLTKMYSTVFDALRKTPGCTRLSETLREELRATLAPHQSEIHRLMEAAQKAPGVYHDEYNASKDPLVFGDGGCSFQSHPRPQPVHYAARELELAARLDAEDGNAMQAGKVLLAGLRITCAQRDIFEFCLDSFHLIDCFRQTLSFCSFDEASLTQLGMAFQQMEDPQLFARFLVAYRTFLLKAYDNLAAFKGWLKQDYAFRNRLIPRASYCLSEGADWLGYYQREKLRDLRVLDQLLAISQKPTHEIFPAFRAVQEQLKKRYNRDWLPNPSGWILSPFFGLENGLLSSFHNTIELRAATIATAVERYRLFAGSPPDSLDALVPAFVSAIPLDPFDGQPMRYQRNGNGYLIYSIGYNLTDDHGEENPSRNDDISFKVLH